MIFSRRAIQRRLDELRSTIGDSAVDRLVRHLNKPGADRMAAMWEVVVLHSLAAIGTLRYEVPLSSGTHPDIELDAGELCITADVVCVGDEGLDAENPYRELGDSVRRAMKKLGIPMGSLDLRVQSKRTTTSRGTKTVLRLPRPNRLQPFIDEEIVPRLREQIEAGNRVLRIAIDDDEVGIAVTIARHGPYQSTGSYGAYDIPGIKDRNPLYGGLERKAKQLRASDRLTGVIVGDGDCRAMAMGRPDRDSISPAKIVAEFFRQYSAVDFVFLITVEQQDYASWSQRRKLHVSMHVRDECPHEGALETLCRGLMEQLPRPVMSAANGALRARAREYDIGHHGGCEMGGHRMKVSLRELTEVLAGLRTFDDDGAKYVEAARRLPRRGRPNPIQPAIRHNLAEGRLPVSMKVLRGDEDESDGWVEIEFGDPDPAITAFR